MYSDYLTPFPPTLLLQLPLIGALSTLVSPLSCSICSASLNHSQFSLPSHRSRTKAVKDLLSRNCIDTEEYTQEERFVVSQLGLPPCLLHEAKALCAYYEGDSKREAGHLLRANMWDAAHSVITNKLVSLAVINRKALVVCCVYMCVCVFACMCMCVCVGRVHTGGTICCVSVGVTPLLAA